MAMDNVIRNTEKLTNTQVDNLLNLIGLFEDIQIARAKQYIEEPLYNQLCNTIAKQLKPYAKHFESKLLVDNIARKYPSLRFNIDRLD